jgi:hypothetical protein
MLRKYYQQTTENILAYYEFKFCPAYISITKTLHQAVLLSYLVALHKTKDSKEFAYMDEVFIKYLNFKIGVLTHSKKSLKYLGFINVRIAGKPARCHYTINMDKINQALEEMK